MKSSLICCGVDEAGRGCIAGIVVAAAVVFPIGYANDAIQDSKRLSPAQREYAKKEILRDALAFGIGKASVEEIDRHNILQASFMAMHRAIDKLRLKANKISVDGNIFKPYKNIPHECIVKGDEKDTRIAAASILAKTERDEYMKALHELFPLYLWNQNKGYPTEKHVDAVRKYGRTAHHRSSFHIPI